MPKEPYQNPNWDGALIVGVDSMIEPPLPSQQKRVDAPPRKPIPQPLTSINSVQQKVVESPPRKPLPQPLASIDSAQQKMAAGEEASQEKIAAALYKKIAEVPNRTPLPTALHESSGVEEPLPDIDTAQQKIVEEAPPRKPLPSTVATDTAQQGVIVDDFPMMEQPLPVTANTETLEAPPRKPQPVSAGDSSAMDQNQKIIEEAQKLVEESTARDPSMEEDRADGTEQIKNWFLS